MSAPDVSIVITCYNQAGFLAEAIESALTQTGAAVEVLVLDDGSTDDTERIARRYSLVRYLRQPRGGLAASRNAGLAACLGAIVVFLDADDRLLPNACAAGLNALRARPECACAAGRFRLIDAHGRVTAGSPERLAIVETLDLYGSLLHHNHIGMHAAVMYRRDIFDLAGNFDTSLEACEDYDLLLRIARIRPICLHDVVVAEYRRHPANMSLDLARMLRAALTVHARQWRYIRRRPQYWEVYHAGRAFWQAYYGDPLAQELRVRAAEATRLRSLLRDLWTLGVYYPPGFRLAYRDVLRQCLTPKRVRGMVRHRLVGSIRRVVPAPLRTLARRLYGRLKSIAGQSGGARGPQKPASGPVDFGALRRLSPFSVAFGFDRGQPIDRHYIEEFLARNAAHVRGRVLEIGDRNYTTRFGGSRVTHSDVLHVYDGTPHATIVADLAQETSMPSAAFDCIICTQTLHLIYEVRHAIGTLHRTLKPGGVVLATVPGITQISHDEWRDCWYWAFTSLSIRRLFEEWFPPAYVAVEARGNVLAATAFLYGLAAHEIEQQELAHNDPAYQVVIMVRARKPLLA